MADNRLAMRGSSNREHQRIRARGWEVVRLIRVGMITGLTLLGSVDSWAATPVDGIQESALAPHSGPRAEKMFTSLLADETGIRTENRYNDPSMWAARYADFMVGSIGTGVAIGDYDADGWPDIFVVSKTETCRLFRNLGDWKFEDVTAKAGVEDVGEAAGIWKQGATFTDVNNDGLLDLYVCRFNAPNLLYINQGSGVFQDEAAPRGLAVNDASVMAAFCDYDRDGWLDVFVQTNRPESIGHLYDQRNFLFHNNGDGTFTDVTESAGIHGKAQGHSATWWDYDNDGWPDLYVANDFTPPDQLYHNNRDGTFTDTIDHVVPHTPFSSMGSDLGDVNNDGLIDLLVADMAATTHQKDQRTMANARGLIVEPAPESSRAPFFMRNALYLNTGTAHLLEAAHLTGLAATDWTWAVRFEDLDNDGWLDLFATNGMYREPHNADLMARIAAAETLADKIRMMRASPELVERPLAFRNLGDLRFENVSAAWGLDHKGISFGVAFGDLDRDGDLDLIHTNYRKGVTVLRNDSDTGRRVIIELRGTRSNRFGIGATVEIETAAGIQIRQLVLARGVLSSSEPLVHFGLGKDVTLSRLTVTWPSGQRQSFDNLPVDRRFTITEPMEINAPPDEHPGISGQFREVSEDAKFAFSFRAAPREENREPALVPMKQNRRGPGIAVGDVNGDGIDDAVVGGTSGDPIRLVVGDAQGRFETVTSPSFAPSGSLNEGPLLLFDFDGDDRIDLLATKGGTGLPAGDRNYQPRLWRNEGRGEFKPVTEGTLPPVLTSVGAVAAADFDRSGRLSLFIGGRVIPGSYPASPQSALMLNRGGRFEDVTEAVAPGLREIGMVTSALWTDVDGDGWLDLMLALEWGGVKYFHNDRGRRFQDRSDEAGFTSAGAGWWTSLAAADFNGDGKLDYVVGNVGLNTPYQADEQHPVVLLSGKFAGGEGTQLIEGYYEGGRLYPRRSRRDLGAAIPSILQRFPRNDSYARATLAEIVGEKHLASAVRLSATEFRSGVFMSRLDGTYRFEALPRIAQISPFQGIVADDFDGDGHADIFGVQNSFAPIPSVGRFDGGLSQLLRGDGQGRFTPVPPRESGLVVPGDGEAVVTTDFNADGRPDLLVSRNGSSTLAFRNGGVAGRHSLCIRLRGPAGNPTGVGARVTLEFADGTKCVREIHAGAGYYSQSTAACFFGWNDANPARTAHVRWTSGFSSEHPVPAGSALLIIDGR